MCIATVKKERSIKWFRLQLLSEENENDHSGDSRTIDIDIVLWISCNFMTTDLVSIESLGNALNNILAR